MEKLNLVKYSNRKLYSTERRSYVNLLAVLQEVVAHGRDIQVTDRTTGADVTAATLQEMVAKFVLPQGSVTDLHAILRTQL